MQSLRKELVEELESCRLNKDHVYKTLIRLVDEIAGNPAPVKVSTPAPVPTPVAEPAPAPAPAKAKAPTKAKKVVKKKAEPSA